MINNLQTVKIQSVRTFSRSTWVALVSSWIYWSWCFDMLLSQYTIT